MDKTLTLTITVPAEHASHANLVDLLREAAIQYEAFDTSNLYIELTIVPGADADITLE